MKLSQMTGSIEQRVCLFGPPKVGKTLLAAKLAEKYKLLVFDLENGSSVMSQIPREWQDRVEVIKIRDSRVYPIAIETMMKVLKGDAVLICHAHSKVACPVCSKAKEAGTDRVCLNELGLDTIVIIDSLTQLTNSGIAHITKGYPDDYKLQLDDWGSLKVLMDKFLSQVQVAKYHVICVSHEEEVSFEDGRKKIVPVAGSANSSRNTAKYFDHVVYCNVVNKKHVVGSATDYSMSVLTGSRTNVKLEAEKTEASLLDVFTNWRLPNYGLVVNNTDTNNSDGNSTGDSSVVAVSNTGNSTPTPDKEGREKTIEEPERSISLTPGQIALQNLRNRKT